MSEVGAQIRESRDHVNLNQSRVEEKVSSQIDQEEAITKLCSKLSLGCLPVPEPDVFICDPLEFTSWLN